MVEGAVIHDPGVPLFALLYRVEVNVGCLTGHVLGVGYSTYCLVEGWATIATTDDYRFAYMLAKWLQDLFAEVLDVRDEVGRNAIADASGASG